MARAKRTDRADARRRYRQFQAGEIDGNEASEEAPGPSRGSRPAPTVPARPSIGAAFRNAYHRANIREDIGFLPGLLLSRAFIASVGLILVGAIAYAALPGYFIPGLLFQTLVYPPAMAPIFIVGFFARRASYLLGLIVALVDVVAFAAVVYYLPVANTSVAPADESQFRQQLVFSAISVGPLSGIFFAAAAAWYRRFLYLSNARAQQRRQASSRTGRPARG